MPALPVWCATEAECLAWMRSVGLAIEGDGKAAS